MTSDNSQQLSVAEVAQNNGEKPMPGAEPSDSKFVSRATTAEVMNVLLSMRVDNAASRARTDTLIEAMQGSLAKLEDNVTKLRDAFSDNQGKTATIQEAVRALQEAGQLRETKIREHDKDMESLSELKEAVRTLKDEVRDLRKAQEADNGFRNRAVGLAIGFSALWPIVYEFIIKPLLVR